MKLAERIFKRNDYYITSPFGYRINPITNEKGEYHNGVDYGTNKEKWKQYAVENGTVISCGLDKNYGNAKYVWVKYPRLNIKLLYYHLDTICVTKGQEVNENTVIGTTGMTGYATGIHLHLGMKYLNKDVYVDAEQFDYQPIADIVPVGRDSTKHQIEVTYNKLNARKSPNGDKLGLYVPVGYYNVLDETTIDNQRWVRINNDVWCALIDDCYNEYKADTEPNKESEYKKMYELEKTENERLNSVISKIKALCEE